MRRWHDAVRERRERVTRGYRLAAVAGGGGGTRLVRVSSRRKERNGKESRLFFTRPLGNRVLASIFRFSKQKSRTIGGASSSSADSSIGRTMPPPLFLFFSLRLFDIGPRPPLPALPPPVLRSSSTNGNAIER